MKKALRLKRIFILILFPITLAFYILAKVKPEFSEYYALNIYKPIAVTLNSVSSAVPFSITEFLILAAILSALVFIIVSIVSIIKNKNKMLFLAAKFVINIACILSVVWFLFMFLSGINYHRYTFLYTAEIEIVNNDVVNNDVIVNTKEENNNSLKELCLYFSQKLGELREKTKEKDGVMVLSSYEIKLAYEAKEAYAKLAEKYPVLSGNYGIPKPVLFSKVMSMLGITGLYFPFTQEANVNIHTSDYVIPFTMCHELSHLRGYMREDEANFLAFLACMESENPDFLYSGTLIAFTTAANALYKADSSLYSEVMQTLPESVINDIKANKEYWNSFKSIISDVSSNINDAYLKANNQKDGVDSYGKMVDLLLAYFKEILVTESSGA